MREILYRGFYRNAHGDRTVVCNREQHKGCWVYGLPFLKDYDDGGAICIANEPLWANDYGEIAGANYYVLPATIGQYTGHNDITGKRIFEGDIIRYDNGIGSIVWSEPNAAFMCREEDGEYHEWFDLLENIEVIGNIYEKESTDENDKV